MRKAKKSQIKICFIVAFLLLITFGCSSNNDIPTKLQPTEIQKQHSPNIPPDTLISLERTGCYGTCSAYTLVILTDGTVIFGSSMYYVRNGKESVQKSLRPIKSEISKEQLQQIIDEFERANFFSLKDSYRDVSDGCPTWGTDAPSVFVSIQINGRKKSIEHNLGCRYSGKDFPRVFPKELYELENKIDEIVNTEQWLK
ncbi:MAG: DUF6438 domain-containing protein [Pyrinomonadaceae bacterium]